VHGRPLYIVSPRLGSYCIADYCYSLQGSRHHDSVLETVSGEAIASAVVAGSHTTGRSARTHLLRMGTMLAATAARAMLRAGSESEHGTRPSNWELPHGGGNRVLEAHDLMSAGPVQAPKEKGLVRAMEPQVNAEVPDLLPILQMSLTLTAALLQWHHTGWLGQRKRTSGGSLRCRGRLYEFLHCQQDCVPYSHQNKFEQPRSRWNLLIQLSW
jgi:hypothetical protein